jgi:ADP-ribosylation factor related protein 1
LILGIDKAGKTTLLEKIKTIYTEFEGLPPDKILPTVGLNIGRAEAFNSKLVFWDLGGQTGLRTIWDKYYAEAHAVIFVVDTTEQDRFEDAKSAFNKAINSKDLKGAPVLVLANKMDLNNQGITELEKTIGVAQVCASCQLPQFSFPSNMAC